MEILKYNTVYEFKQVVFETTILSIFTFSAAITQDYCNPHQKKIKIQLQYKLVNRVSSLRKRSKDLLCRLEFSVKQEMFLLGRIPQHEDGDKKDSCCCRETHIYSRKAAIQQITRCVSLMCLYKRFKCICQLFLSNKVDILIRNLERFR